MARVEVFDERVCQLGEGPYYDDRSARVYWVDILGARVLWRGEGPGELPTGSHVGAAVPCDSGRVVLCLPAGPVLAELAGGELRPLGTYAEADAAAGVPASASVLRSNDAKADAAGRLWHGTMAYDETPGAGALYRLDPEADRPVRILGGVTISNGLGWSPDGATMYYVDTPTRTIDSFAYDGATGELGERRPYAHVDGGSPDGLCVDAEGAVWLALWGGSAVRRYVGGSLERTVRLPTPRVTSCAFVGPRLDRLVITTASVGMTDDPYAGLTYVYEPGDVIGLPTARFGR